MKLNGFALKLIALVLMFGEHFGLYLGELLPAHVPLYLHTLGALLPRFSFSFPWKITLKPVIAVVILFGCLHGHWPCKWAILSLAKL